MALAFVKAHSYLATTEYTSPAYRKPPVVIYDNTLFRNSGGMRWPSLTIAPGLRTVTHLLSSAFLLRI